MSVWHLCHHSQLNGLKSIFHFLTGEIDADLRKLATNGFKPALFHGALDENSRHLLGCVTERRREDSDFANRSLDCRRCGGAVRVGRMGAERPWRLGHRHDGCYEL